MLDIENKKIPYVKKIMFRPTLNTLLVVRSNFSTTMAC